MSSRTEPERPGGIVGCCCWCIFRLCWCCCLRHPDPVIEDKELLQELLTEQEEIVNKEENTEKIELKADRKYELCLVFNLGREDATYNSLDDPRKRELFSYMNLEKGEDAVGMKKKTNDKENMVFYDFITTTEKVLKANGFLVKYWNDDMNGDVKAKVTKLKLAFFLVGMTEKQYRDWAARRKYLLEVDPLMTLEWLRVNNDKLALATVSQNVDFSVLVNEAQWDDIYVPYFRGTPSQVYQSRRILWQDDPEMGDYSIFRSSDRIKLLISKMEAPKQQGGSGMDLGGLTFNDDHPLMTVYAIHLKDYRDEIWKNTKGGLFEIPIDDIREYYGEYVAMYFAFLQYFNYCLLLPTVLGAVVFTLQLVDNRINDSWSVFLAVCMVFWGQICIEGWKYREYFLQQKWGQGAFEKEPIPRPEFVGEWVYSPVDGKLMPYFDPIERMNRLIISYSVITVCISLVIGNIVLIASLQKWVEEHTSEDDDWLPSAFGVFSAIQIMIFDTMYALVADAMNNYENHKTDEEYEFYMIQKTFVFRFVNAYNALFFVAFVKFYTDGCEDGSPEDGCFKELRVSLATIFGTQLVVGNLGEILPAYFASADPFTGGKDPVYDEYNLGEYDSTFEDFSEIIMKFGYTTIFVIAFPLSCLICLVGNLVEVRVDGYKFFALVRRPNPAGAKTIGAWTGILSVMGWISTACNLVIITIIFKSFQGLVNMADYTTFDLILLATVSYHVVGFTFLILIPRWNSFPDKISRHYQRQEHIRNALHSISLDVQGELATWEDWSKRELMNYLKSDAMETRAEAIEKLSGMDGRGIHDTSPDILKRRYMVHKKDIKWAWSHFRTLMKADKEVEREETFNRLLHVVDFANRTKNRVPIDNRNKQEVYREFDYFKFGAFLQSLHLGGLKKIWDVVADSVPERKEEVEEVEEEEDDEEDLDWGEKRRRILEDEIEEARRKKEEEEQAEEQRKFDELEAERLREEEANKITPEEKKKIDQLRKIKRGVDGTGLHAPDAIPLLLQLSLLLYLQEMRKDVRFRISDNGFQEILDLTDRYCQERWYRIEGDNPIYRDHVRLLGEWVIHLDTLSKAADVDEISSMTLDKDYEIEV